MDTCLFCKIIRGELPCEKVYEDETTFAFLDIKPVNPGHTLVIPKNHHENIFELPPEIAGKIIQAAKKIALALKQASVAESFNLTMNNGAPSGQVVFHAHMHVIPRHEGDGYELWHGKAYEEGEREKMAEKIRSTIS